MRIGCLSIAAALLAFAAYGLYVSWGIAAVYLLAAAAALMGILIGVRLQAVYKKQKRNEETEEIEAFAKQDIQPVLQDPDLLLARFRQQHAEGEVRVSQAANEEEAFQRAVEEVKRQQHAHDSDRMTWIRQFEQYTERFVQRAQFKTHDPLMRRLNSLFILNGLLHIRVFVNLVQIAEKMGRLPQSAIEELDHALVRMSKREFEKLNRMIALHYLDLFLTDHASSLYFNDTFTKRSLMIAVLDGLSFSKQETLLLRGIQTDTQFIEAMFDVLKIEADQPWIDLAKTAFENTKTPLFEKLAAEIRNQAH